MSEGPRTTFLGVFRSKIVRAPGGAARWALLSPAEHVFRNEDITRRFACDRDRKLCRTCRCIKAEVCSLGFDFVSSNLEADDVAWLSKRHKAVHSKSSFYGLSSNDSLASLPFSIGHQSCLVFLAPSISSSPITAAVPPTSTVFSTFLLFPALPLASTFPSTGSTLVPTHT